MNRTMRTIMGMIFTFCVLSVSATTATGQPEKGDKEVLVLAGNTFIGLGDRSGNVSFSASGKLGYYFTRRNEVGGGISFFVDHFKVCSRTIDSDGHIIFEQCDSGTNAGVGFSAFYRFNMAREGARGFPFIGGEIAVADVTQNFTGNWRARPHVGYKYFLKKNIGLDFSFGYTVDINKVKSSFTFIDQGRQGNLDGQIGLIFLF
jgi:hypothetical protein